MNSIHLQLIDEVTLPPGISIVLYQLNNVDFEQTMAVVWLVVDLGAEAPPYRFTYTDIYRLLVTDASGAQETALAEANTNYSLLDMHGQKVIRPRSILNSTSSTSWQIQLQNCLPTESFAVELKRSTTIRGSPTWNTIAKFIDLAPNQTATFEFPHAFTSSPVLYVFSTTDHIEVGQTIDVMAYSAFTTAIAIPPQHAEGTIVAHLEGDSEVVFTGYFFTLDL